LTAALASWALKDIAARSTVGTRPDCKEFLAIFRKPWVLAEEQEAARVAEEFVQRVVEKAVPFWKRFANPTEVLRLLSGNLEDARRYAGTDEFAAKRAIALGIILCGSRKAREITDAVLSKLKGQALDEVKCWAEKALA
jgi:hypothetical protein